jgi:heat-inducible transcriptional repressor
MRDAIMQEINERRDELGTQVAELIESGLAFKLDDGKLIVSGKSQLVQEPSAMRSIDHVKLLMEQLEAKETVSKLLEEATNADGVKIYIGSDNSVFKGSGHSLVLSPYRNSTDHIVGAIGVIGPTRLNYAKVIPSVNFMAEMLSRRIK